MSNISVNWKVFDYKFSDAPNAAFESFAYTLFCYEFKQSYGIFRYFNQPYIETQPVKTDDGHTVGFQAKYYDANTLLSSKKKDLVDTIDGAKNKYTDIDKLVIYTNKELSTSSKKNKVKPDYQIEIEQYGSNIGIQVEWRVRSNFEIILNSPELIPVKELYFDPDSGLQKFAGKIQKRSTSILESIKSDISFNDKTIKIEYDQKTMIDFIQSDNKIFIVYGCAGTGKSGYLKDAVDYLHSSGDLSVLVFAATDFDVEDEISLLNQFGNYNVEDLLSLYNSEEHKYCIIESAEKYSNFKNFEVLRTAIHKFIDSGWKLIFSIREQYKEGFCNSILDGIAIDQFYIDSIKVAKLKTISEEYGFNIPSNNNLCNLICNLFYLKIYLQLLSSSTDIPSDARSFIDHIWRQLIRNESTRRDNLPVRRENFLVEMVLSLLNNEEYIYKSKATNDSEVITLLEDQGIISPYNDTPDLWVFSHDVYEEIIVNHVFDSKYNSTQDIAQITEVFNNSLRSRKMYRIWLESKLRETDSNLLAVLTKALESTNLPQSWKDETLIALMNSENEEAFQIMESMFSKNGFALFTRSLFLLNTACICIKRNSKLMQLVKDQKLNNYHFTEPTGKAWHTIFGYIYKCKSLIPWNQSNLSIVFEAMNSWVSNNPTGKTTYMIGHTALFLKEKIWNESDLKYGLYQDSAYISMNKIIMLSANEIKNELVNMVDTIIRNKEYSYSDKDYVFLTKALSNIYDGGKIFVAIPEQVLRLAWEYWFYKDDNNHFSSFEIEDYFGLNNNLTDKYFPSSSYQTPMLALLHSAPKQSIDFILKLTNNSANCYKKSSLSNECYEIQIILTKEERITQVCSDRLWKIHRGTNVAPYLLESILMALEEFLLQYVNSVSKDDAIALCLYLLRNSNNVAITAVVLSVVIANPSKLFDISCILLKTKELFELDNSRFLSEHSSNYFRGLSRASKRFDDERINSNNQTFRKNKFEDVILNYQINSDNIAKSDVEERREKIFNAIDEATKEIDSWHPLYQSYYYVIDLRKYEQEGEAIIKDGNICVPLKSKIPQQVIEYSKKNNEIYAEAFGDTELLLWASARYKNEEKYKSYHKYEDNPIAAYQEIKKLLDSANEGSPLLSIDIIVFTTAVLLRDFEKLLDEEKAFFCKAVILRLGLELVKNNPNLLYDVYAKSAIINEIAHLSDSKTIKLDWNNPALILLAFMFDFRKQCENSIINPLANLWKNNRKLANRLIITFIKLIPQFDGKDIFTFIEIHKEELTELLTSNADSIDTVDVNTLNYNTLVYLSSILDNSDSSMLNLSIKIGKILWDKMFFDNYNDNIRKNHQLEPIYMKWLAELMLNLSNDERSILIQEMMPLIRLDREFNFLLSHIVTAEDTNPRYDAFWDLWLSMREYIFPIYEKIADDYRNTNKGVDIGYGFEDVLVNYLLANPYWREDVTEWHSLKPNNGTFYLTAANRLGYNPTTLYSIARVLYTVGKKPFIDDGIIWLSEIIKGNPHLYTKPLLENTLFYIEEYIFSYVKKHNADFRTQTNYKSKVLIVLDFLVERGSTVGFLLREEII